MKNPKRLFVTIWKIAFVILITFAIQRIKLIKVPDAEQMENFQFNLITVSTVFSGFSFTVLGMLLGMFSESMIEKLKDTNIVTRKSSKLMKSIMAFSGSWIISLLFIVGGNQFINGKWIDLFNEITEYFFTLGVILMVIGIIYFISSTIGVFQMISKIYAKKVDDYKEREKAYKEELEKAKYRIKQKQ